MLATPIGRLIVAIDGQPIDYYAEKMRPDEFCPNINGRYLIEIDLPPDEKEHKISCRMEEYLPNGMEKAESDEKLETKIFYQKQVTLALGMKADTQYITGLKYPARDYDREFLPDGVQYLTFPFTKTERFSFGAAWLKQSTEETAGQTRIGADPGTMRFQKDHPRWKKEQEERRRDKLLGLAVEYRRADAVEQERIWTYHTEWTERFVLDRSDFSMEYHLCTQGREMSAVYKDLPPVQRLFERMEEVNFPKAQSDLVPDVLQNQETETLYRITALYAREGRRVLTGRLDRYGIPEHFEEFVDGLYTIIGFPSVSDVLDEKVYHRVPRRRSDRMFCEVLFAEACPGRTFSYLCEDEDIKAGSWVLAPFGKSNRILAGEVYRVTYAQPEDAPYPIKRIKSIIKECTQADLIELEKQEKAVDSISYRRPDAHYAVSFKECPLLQRRIYWGGRGGCCDVRNAIWNEAFMAHFDPPFDPQQARDICARCGWRGSEDDYE